MDVSDQPNTSKATLKPRKQMRKNLSKLAKICDRSGSTDRAGAAIATAVLEDFGIVTMDDQSNVIDQYKLRLARTASRFNAVSGLVNMPSKPATQTLYFDGRKVKTMKMIQKGGR